MIKTTLLRRQSDSSKKPAGRDELIEAISNDLYTTKSDASLIIDSVVKAITDLANKHESVKVPCLGQFKVMDTPSREGRNPRSGELVEIAPGKRVTFRAAKAFKAFIAKLLE